MTNQSRKQASRPPRTIDPMPGLWLTAVLSWPYLSDRMTSFPRSTGHDILFGIIVALIWGCAFFWGALGRTLPLVHTLIRLVIAVTVWSAVAALYGTIIYFIVMS